jgi:hypothetical protein
MKKFLLLAGQHYYPGAGTQDWIGTFETKEETLKWAKLVLAKIRKNMKD